MSETPSAENDRPVRYEGRNLRERLTACVETWQATGPTQQSTRDLLADLIGVLGEYDGTCVLDIEWDRPSSTSPMAPRLVGPFSSRSEAEEWAALNVRNGSFECRPVAPIPPEVSETRV